MLGTLKRGVGASDRTHLSSGHAAGFKRKRCPRGSSTKERPSFFPLSTQILRAVRKASQTLGSGLIAAGRSSQEAIPQGGAEKD
jgi:hypothetical protein